MDVMSEKKEEYLYIYILDVLVSFIQKMASDNEKARKKEKERERQGERKTWLLITSRKCYI